MRSQHRRGPLRAFAGVGVAVALLAVPALTQLPATADAAAKVPNTAKLAGPLAKQKLTWETCDFGSPALNARLNQPNVKCATVKVPQDWRDPANGKTWDIRISQAKNREVTDGRYKGTIFVNPGGPGGSGLPWGPVMQERAVDLNPYYNYVGFDPRGVGQSSRPTCTYEWDDKSGDPYAQEKAIGATCGNDPQIKTITTEQTVYDMDFIRHLLRAPKLSYIGYSYGTWLGAWYENVFGTKYGDKFVLDSATDATAATLEPTWNEQPLARDRQFRAHLMNWIARQDDTYGLGERPRDIYQRYLDATADLDPTVILLAWVATEGFRAFPDNSRYPTAAAVVAALIKTGEATDGPLPMSSAGPAAAASDLLATAAESATGEAADELAEAEAKLAPLRGQETGERPGSGLATGTFGDTFDMIRCNDGQWTQGAKYWERFYAQQRKKAPLSAQWGLLDGVPVCAFWRTQNLMPVADEETFPKTILLQSELDSQTGWFGAYRAGTGLPNTSFIAVDNEGSHGIFPYGTEAADRPVYRFFLQDRMPKDITVTQALPLPEETVTYESWSKLNKRAKHTGGENTDPWKPAQTPRRTAAPVDRALIATADEALLAQQVRKLYGEAGVEALNLNGR